MHRSKNSSLSLLRRALLGLSLAFSPCTSVPASTTLPDKVVYFTFDDGPSRTYTPQVLNLLRNEHVKATFFLVGSRCTEEPNLVRRIVAEGHEVGNHGYTHQFITNESLTTLQSEVKRTDDAIYRASGLKPVYFRPPGGLFRVTELATLHALGHRTVLWTVDSRDWHATAADPIVENVVEHVKPGAVVLFHDGLTPTKFTIAALPVIISTLRHQGYHFDILPVARRTVFKVF